MRRLARTLLPVSAALAAALVLGGAAGCGSDTPTGPMIAVNKRTTAPEVKGELLGGGTFDLASHKGGVVVINFWASNCAPCRTEAPELQATYDATNADGVTFVGISVRDEKDKAESYLADVKTPYGSLFDPSGETALDFQVPPTTIPSTLVVDRKGRLASVFRGIVYQKQLEPILRDLLKESS
jgi:thiol-disulfide isomerase/thioredoxin